MGERPGLGVWELGLGAAGQIAGPSAAGNQGLASGCLCVYASLSVFHSESCISLSLYLSGCSLCLCLSPSQNPSQD